MTCFHRVCSAVDLSDVAKNAASLRGKPAEEKSSLSRLSGAVLGNPNLVYVLSDDFIDSLRDVTVVFRP